MKKMLVIVAALLCCSCENDFIMACSRGCSWGGKAMLRYSQSNGCECADAMPQDAGTKDGE